jgi:glycosyltransferase involved in cell wall biosynthesis
MRIAVLNWSRRRVGGTETYLSLIIPELARAGHEISFWHETDKPAGREEIELPEGAPAWCVSRQGARRALAALREWRPDLIYSHGLHTPRLEAETVRIAPAVLFAHAYHGTCISGAKTFKRPHTTPCDRRFGWECLGHYFPRRCGGLSPVTMLRLYRQQSSRLATMRGYKAVLTHSTHMQSEYLKHGIEPGRVFNLSYYAHGADVPALSATDAGVEGRRAAGKGEPPCRLLFLGRMEYLKGGRLMIDALPRIRAALGRPLRVTFAGDGPDRPQWERRAAKACRKDAGLEVEFTGWLGRQQLDALYGGHDLLVFPSLWPEPFGLVGPEAGLRGLPVAAFRVGGVPDWLIDGLNGYLAPGSPPTADGLADAVVKCLRDPAEHARLRRGAVQVAERFNLRNHLSALLEIFERVAGENRPAAVEA